MSSSTSHSNTATNPARAETPPGKVSQRPALKRSGPLNADPPAKSSATSRWSAARTLTAKAPRRVSAG